MKYIFYLATLLLSLVFSPPISADTDMDAEGNPTDQSVEDKQSATTATGFATNSVGDLDKPVVYEDGQKKVWKHKLPFLAQEVLDKGFDLPPPYGVSAIYTNVLQDLALSDLRISFGDPNQSQTQVPFVSFEPSFTDTTAYNLKLDAWLFPFMNVFLIANTLDGKGLVPIVVPGEGALKALFPDIGARCDDPPGHPLRPAACDKDYVLIDEPAYTGKTVGVGVILPIGWKNFFAAIPLSYTISDTSNTSGKIKTFQGSLRLGFHFQPKKTGQIAFYTGATYLDTEQDVHGVFEIDTGVPEIGEIDINYTIHQSPADKVNYLVGFNWVLTKHWWLQAEVGFGGTRDDLIASFSYRW
jgi:hypothetical protein